MNRLIRIMLSFVLLFFCLFISVSYAVIIEPNEPYSSNSSAFSNSSSSSTNTLEGYTPVDIAGAVQQYIVNSDATVLDPILQDLSSKGYSKSIIYITMNGTVPKYYISIFPDEFEFDFTHIDSNPVGASDLIGIYAPANSYYYTYWFDRGYTFMMTVTQKTNSSAYCYDKINSAGSLNYSSPFLEFNNLSVKEVTRDNYGYYIWDGTSYYYEAAPDEPDTPSLPSNAEIAQVVQSFYDSDLYKNNTNFKDFMVVYSFITGYYSIIGTDNHLLQEIYYDGAKPSNDDFTYPDTWWRFYNYFGNAQNLFYGWDYWLYSTRKEDDSFSPISYDGVGKINDLFKLKFTNQSIIVYSSYEYKVYEFRPPTEEGGSNSSTVTTILGDEYTYDENLDPTDSEYSPIQNYISTNPGQTILGDVDFNEINKTFEENKGILNIENARWLFAANNQFVGYFIGFLSLLIVFLIISRILGG